MVDHQAEKQSDNELDRGPDGGCRRGALRPAMWAGLGGGTDLLLALLAGSQSHVAIFDASRQYISYLEREVVCGLTFDMRDNWRPKAGRRPLDGIVRPHSFRAAMIVVRVTNRTSPQSTTSESWAAWSSPFHVGRCRQPQRLNLRNA